MSMISSLELWGPALWFDPLSPWCPAWASYTLFPALKSSSSETQCTHLYNIHTYTDSVACRNISINWTYPAVKGKEIAKSRKTARNTHQTAKLLKRVRTIKGKTKEKSFAQYILKLNEMPKAPSCSSKGDCTGRCRLLELLAFLLLC